MQGCCYVVPKVFWVDFSVLLGCSGWLLCCDILVSVARVPPSRLLFFLFKSDIPQPNKNARKVTKIITWHKIGWHRQIYWSTGYDIRSLKWNEIIYIIWSMKSDERVFNVFERKYILIKISVKFSNVVWDIITI